MLGKYGLYQREEAEMMRWAVQVVKTGSNRDRYPDPDGNQYRQTGGTDTDTKSDRHQKTRIRHLSLFVIVPMTVWEDGMDGNMQRRSQQRSSEVWCEMKRVAAELIQSLLNLPVRAPRQRATLSAYPLPLSNVTPSPAFNCALVIALQFLF